MATYHVIGQSTPRVDGAAKATGQARYAADVILPGTLWGKSLHSPYAHARIVRIDTTAAQQVPGVRAVITGVWVPVGVSHAPPGMKAWLGARIVSKFSALKRSSATLARLRPNRRIFATRKSS